MAPPRSETPSGSRAPSRYHGEYEDEYYYEYTDEEGDDALFQTEENSDNALYQEYTFCLLYTSPSPRDRG